MYAIDKDTYQRFLRRIEDEINALMKKYKVPDVEISNLGLVKDIERIIKLEEVLSSNLSRFDQVIAKPNHKYQMQNYDAPSQIIHQPF